MSAFKEIQRDPDVCSNCFRRTHDRFENNFIVRQDHGELYIEEVEDQDDSVYRRHQDTMRIPEKRVYGGMTTVCECGFRYEPDAEWKNRPAPKGTLMRYAENLARRLEEAGVGFDHEEFLDIVREWKSDPGRQFRDDELLDEAVSEASARHRIRNGRRAGATGGSRP